MSKRTNIPMPKTETVALDDLRVNPSAQREERPGWTAKIVAEWDDAKAQMPHVSRREDGTLYIVEGQHTQAARREVYGPGQKVRAQVYTGLTEEQEAELFLALNDKKPIDAMSKFKTGVTAGLDVPCDIDRIVRANGCVVGVNAGANSISAVSALTSIYNRHGAQVLGETLRIIADAFNEGGYERPVILGISQVLARFPDADRARMVLRLAGLRNGWNGVTQKISFIRSATGCNATDAAAAAVVEIYNSGRGGKKLPNWFRDDIIPSPI